ALMGSLAASRYTSSLSSVTDHLPASVQQQANTSLSEALSSASTLGGAAGHALTTGANEAFIAGIQLAVTVGALFAAIAAVVVFRFLPHEATHSTGAESPLDAMEVTAELGLAGVEPAYDD